MMRKMKLLANFLCFLVMLHCSYAPPVGETTKAPDDPEWAEYMEYHRYLKEVVQALESDPDFKAHLEKASDDDIKSGKLAEQLDFVNHNVRTKLDEIKRRELDRLRHLATKQYELMNNLDDNGKVPSNEHLDHGNPHTFEIEDLKKLIQKATADLEAVDKKRREEFKEYEMQKKFEEHKKMEDMNENEKKEYLEKLKKEEEAIKHHQPLHHPVTKEQLLDVWKNADNMDSKDFNPKVFFVMHDIDGNGVWDADEVKALFIKELDKLYAPNGPNKDLHERAEEMERMREHVFKEYDTNHDGLIEIGEFLAVTQKDQFNKDEGWKTIDDNQIYTQNEYEEYERARLDEFRYLQSIGLVDAHGKPVPGSEHQIHQAIVQYRAHKQQQAYQQHLQYQQSHPGQPVYYPQGQVPSGQNPHYQQPQQVYQQQGQVPQYQTQYQVPQGQFQGQQPQQGQFQGQQPPPGYLQGQQQTQGKIHGQQPVQGQPQGQQPQGNFQGQQPPQAQFQGQQMPQGQFQQPSQWQIQSQPAHNLNQAQAPPVPQAQPIPKQQNQGQESQDQGQTQNNNQVPQVPPAKAQNQSPPANLGASH